MKPKLTDDEFISAWKRLQSTSEVAKLTGGDVRNVQHRRRKIEARYSIVLAAVDSRSPDTKLTLRPHNRRADLAVKSCTVIVFSDAH